MSDKTREFNWENEEKLMKDNYPEFADRYYDDSINPRSRTMDNIKFTNKYNVEQSDDFFTFDYEVGHRLHSLKSKCY